MGVLDGEKRLCFYNGNQRSHYLHKTLESFLKLCCLFKKNISEILLLCISIRKEKEKEAVEAPPRPPFFPSLDPTGHFHACYAWSPPPVKTVRAEETNLS